MAPGRRREDVSRRKLLERGTRLVFGSDVPVASIDPREGVFAALDRRLADGSPAKGWRPDEKLGFADAVQAYTVAAAHAAGVAPDRGVLPPGYDADLVAWEADPSVEAGDGAAFRASHAALTVVGGRVVMRR